MIAYLALACQLGIGLVTAETFRHSDIGSKISGDKIHDVDTTAHIHVLAFQPGGCECGSFGAYLRQAEVAPQGQFHPRLLHRAACASVTNAIAFNCGHEAISGCTGSKYLNPYINPMHGPAFDVDTTAHIHVLAFRPGGEGRDKIHDVDTTAHTHVRVDRVADTKRTITPSGTDETPGSTVEE